MACVSSSNNNNTNKAINTAQAVDTAIGVSIVGTQVNTTNIDNLNDAVICAFLASQPSSPQLINKDLEQIHPDDLEEMDLKWQMPMLTMSARRPTWSATTATKWDTLLGSVELQKVKIPSKRKAQEGLCLWKYLLQQLWECRAPKSQDTKQKESTRRTVPVEIPTSTALVSCDGFSGYNWSDQAEEGPNYALMAYTSTSNFMPLKPDLSYIGLEEFADKPVMENKSSEEVTKAVRKNLDALIVEDWVSDDEEENVTQPKIVKKTVKPGIPKIEFVKPRQQEKKARNTIKQIEKPRQNTHGPRENQRN
nr:hypothetical protein [Tanacetum cinerariifolium]